MSPRSRASRMIESPSRPGSIRSRTTSRGRRSWIARSAVSPSAAVATRNRSRSRYVLTSATILGSSSTTRIGASRAGMVAIICRRDGAGQACRVDDTPIAARTAVLLGRRDVCVESEPVRGIEAPLQLPQASPGVRWVGGRDATRGLVELRVVEVAPAPERPRGDAIREATGPGDLGFVVRGVRPDRERGHIRDRGSTAECSRLRGDPMRLAVDELDEDERVTRRLGRRGDECVGDRAVEPADEMTFPVLAEPEWDRLVEGLLLQPAHRLEIGFVQRAMADERADR